MGHGIKRPANWPETVDSKTQKTESPARQIGAQGPTTGSSDAHPVQMESHPMAETVPATLDIEQVRSPAVQVTSHRESATDSSESDSDDESATSSESDNDDESDTSSESVCQQSAPSGSQQSMTEFDQVKTELGIEYDFICNHCDSEQERNQVRHELVELRRYFGSLTHTYSDAADAPAKFLRDEIDHSGPQGTTHEGQPSTPQSTIERVPDAIRSAYLLNDDLKVERTVVGADGSKQLIAAPTRKMRVIAWSLAQRINKFHHLLRDNTHVGPLVGAINQMIESGDIPELKPVLPYRATATVKPPGDVGDGIPIDVIVDSGGGEVEEDLITINAVDFDRLKSTKQFQLASSDPLTIDIWGQDFSAHSYNATVNLQGVGAVTGEVYVEDKPVTAMGTETVLELNIANKKLLKNVLISENSGIGLQLYNTNTASQSTIEQLSSAYPVGIRRSHLPGGYKKIPVHISPLNDTNRGTRRKLLVDTGASRTVLHYTVAKAAGLTSLDHGSIDWDAVGTIINHLLQIISIKYGNPTDGATIHQYMTTEISFCRSQEAIQRELQWWRSHLSGSDHSTVTDQYNAIRQELNDSIPQKPLDWCEQLISENAGFAEHGDDVIPTYNGVITIGSRLYFDRIALTRDDSIDGAIGQTILKHYLVGPGDQSLIF